jgi:hypothetical protein
MVTSGALVAGGGAIALFVYLGGERFAGDTSTAIIELTCHMTSCHRRGMAFDVVGFWFLIVSPGSSGSHGCSGFASGSRGTRGFMPSWPTPSGSSSSRLRSPEAARFSRSGR